MLAMMDDRLGRNHSGELRQEGAEAKAERIVGEELHRLKWTEEDLRDRRKNDPEKLAIAARLKKETTLTLRQVVSRVHLGSSKSANAKLHQWMREHTDGRGDRAANAQNALFKEIS